MKNLGRYIQYGTPVLADPNRIYCLKCDLGEGRDHSAMQVWHNGKIEYTISADTWIAEKKKEFAKKKKALLYAVTHGYYIRMTTMSDGEIEYYDITKPSILRKVYRTVPFVPRMEIWKGHRRYVVYKGKVRPHKLWPLVKEVSRTDIAIR